MATIIINNLALCSDCTVIAVNGDWSGLDYHYQGEELDNRVKAIENGLTALAQLGHLVMSSEEPDEFSRRKCDCCQSRLAGSRDFFCILK